MFNLGIFSFRVFDHNNGYISPDKFKLDSLHKTHIKFLSLENNTPYIILTGKYTIEPLLTHEDFNLEAIYVGDIITITEEIYSDTCLEKETTGVVKYGLHPKRGLSQLSCFYIEEENDNYYIIEPTYINGQHISKIGNIHFKEEKDV